MSSTLRKKTFSVCFSFQLLPRKASTYNRAPVLQEGRVRRREKREEGRASMTEEGGRDYGKEGMCELEEGREYEEGREEERGMIEEKKQESLT